MNKIKFRITAPTKEVFYMDIESLLFETFSKWELEELKIEQFTGAYDKTGKEIYEGDTIDYEDEGSLMASDEYEVVFENNGFYPLSTINNDNYPEEWGSEYTCKII